MNVLRKKYEKEQIHCSYYCYILKGKIYADVSELLGFGLHF